MEKYIFGFEISMKNIVVMHVLNCIANLFKNGPRLLLVERSFVLEVLVKVSIATEFH